MTEKGDSSQQPDAISRVIGVFLEERLQPKLDKLKEDETDKRRKLLEEYEPGRWIANAARRVGEIQQVTHALKFTHPDAKGTSLNAPGNPQVGETLVGTHLLDEPPLDVVGNAAALVFYKFLKLEVGGETILELARKRSPALRAAFSDDAARAEEWMAAFAELVEPKGELTSHKLAKQVYWPLEEGGYHLLAPLFPTSLVHRVWRHIRDDRFSDEAKAARQAYWNRESHPEGYREYPDLAVQNFGGTKPQNISQFNSERYGENFLLASVPPSWHSAPIRPPLHTQTIFGRILDWRPGIRRLHHVLRDFLARVQEAGANVRIRRTRAELVEQLRDEVLHYAAELQWLEPGWSQDEACRLNRNEQCWLDPGRAEFDEAFAEQCAAGGWQEEVGRRFANWLNGHLTSSRTPMGSAEAGEWQTVLEKEMDALRRELDA